MTALIIGVGSIFAVMFYGPFLTGGARSATPTVAVSAGGPGPQRSPVPVIASPLPPTPTSLPPTPTPLPVGTRQNPVPRGTAYTFRQGNQTYTIQVVDVQRNALAAVKQANMFNPTPPDGEDYILVRLRLQYLQGSEDKPMKTHSGELRIYADNRFWGAPTLSVPPDPEFRGQDLFPGATAEGWLDGKHLPRALMDQAVLVYDSVYFGL